MMKIEALIYLSMGWAVYPAHYVDVEGTCSCGRPDCPTPGKHPIGRWTDFQNRLPTEEEVTTWFTSMECNIGTITGQISGLVVVDVDGPEGMRSVRKLDLKPTLMARTGGGGRHLFYETRSPVPSKVRIMEGIDIRGDGGYVVLPPSTHLSGHFYEWLEPRGLSIFDPQPFEKHGANPFSNGTGWHNNLIKGVEEGNRSNSAARLAGRYLSLGLSPEETWVLMSDWNERNLPPLDERDLMRTVKWAQGKYEKETLPSQITTFQQIQDILQGEDHAD